MSDEITIEQVKALLKDYEVAQPGAERHSAWIALDGVALARLTLSLHAQLQHERQEAAGLRKALEDTTRQNAAESQAHDGTIDQRDRAQEAADRLAYALYSVEEIGEHSNLNDPWENAAELLEALPQQLQQEREAAVAYFEALTEAQERLEVRQGRYTRMGNQEAARAYGGAAHIIRQARYNTYSALEDAALDRPAQAQADAGESEDSDGEECGECEGSGYMSASERREWIADARAESERD